MNENGASGKDDKGTNRGGSGPEVNRLSQFGTPGDGRRSYGPGHGTRYLSWHVFFLKTT